MIKEITVLLGNRAMQHRANSSGVASSSASGTGSMSADHGSSSAPGGSSDEARHEETPVGGFLASPRRTIRRDTPTIRVLPPEDKSEDFSHSAWSRSFDAAEATPAREQDALAELAETVRNTLQNVGFVLVWKHAHINYGAIVIETLRRFPSHEKRVPRSQF